MNDEKLEQLLRELPASEMPAAWRAEILSNAMRATCETPSSRQVWSPVLVYVRNLCLRNPVTAGAMTALWLLIFLLKATTPIDPQEKILLAHVDPNRPVYFVSISDQILQVQFALDESDQRPLRQIP